MFGGIRYTLPHLALSARMVELRRADGERLRGVTAGTARVYTPLACWHARNYNQTQLRNFRLILPPKHTQNLVMSRCVLIARAPEKVEMLRLGEVILITLSLLSAEFSQFGPLQA